MNTTVLSAEKMKKDLSNTSPLKMSKKLIEYELFSQQSSLNVMSEIYQEFEGKDSVIDSLVTPIFLNISDGIIKHPKLKLQKSGITASRLVAELKNFTYDEQHSTEQDSFQDRASLSANSSKHVAKKGKYKRSEMDAGKTKKIADARFNGNKTMNSDIEVNADGSKKRLYRHQNSSHIQKLKASNKKTTHLTQNVDHNIPLKKVFDDYSSKVLSTKDKRNAVNQDTNFDVISEKLNKAKGDQTWEEYIKKGGANLSEKTKKIALQRSAESRTAIENNLNDTVLSKLSANGLNNKHTKKIANTAKDQALDEGTEKGLGEIFILLIKPIYYEFSDIFKNGMISDLDTTTKIDAFIVRMNRVKEYVLKNLAGLATGSFADLMKNFITLLINGLVQAFVGLLKKILEIIVQGFSAITEAIKIMLKPSDQITPAQKADAITKLLATTVVTFLGAYFEESILGFMKGGILEPLKDIIMIMLTGIASTVVVWLLDEADLFSVKDEQRLARVKEIFTLRVENIKKNTDIFEHEALEALAKQKLQFSNILETMNKNIDAGKSVNDSVYDLANFMDIDLQVKNTDDFISMLQNNKSITI